MHEILDGLDFRLHDNTGIKLPSRGKCLVFALAELTVAQLVCFFSPDCL